MAIGGAINLASNYDNIHNLSQGIGYFGLGFIQSAVSMYGGPVGMLAGGFMTGVGNASLRGADGGQVLVSGVIGLAGAGFGSFASGLTGPLVSKVAFSGIGNYSSPFLTGAARGAIGSGIAGFAAGFGTGAIFDPQHALQWGLNGFKTGAITGGITGGAIASMPYIKRGQNPLWTPERTNLSRPYIRVATRNAVESNALKIGNNFVDPNTGNIIEGDYNLGHKYGYEFYKYKSWAESQGMTQSEFNNLMNNPSIYQIEDPLSNMSHLYEAPADIFYGAGR